MISVEIILLELLPLLFGNRETASRNTATPLPQLRNSPVHEVLVKGWQQVFRCFHNKLAKELIK